MNLYHYTPNHFANLVERFSIKFTTDKDFKFNMISTHFIKFFIPLSENGFFYNNKHFNKPILQGVLSQPTTLVIPPYSSLLLIRFFPNQDIPFMNSEAILNGEQFISLDKEVCFSAIEIANILNGDFTAVYRLLENELKAVKNTENCLIREFYRFIIVSTTSSVIDDFCALKQISYMKLYRLCTSAIGITPKKFERIVKFRHAFNRMVYVEDAFKNVALDYGYYDHAHFVKEFKSFSGATPKNLMQYLKGSNLTNNEVFKEFSSI